MLVAMPRQSVRSGFFRVQMLILLGLSVLAGLAISSIGAAPPNPAFEVTPRFSEPALPDAAAWSQSARIYGCAAMAGLAFLGSVLWTLERRNAGTVLLWLILLASLGLLWAAPLLGTANSGSGAFLARIAEAASAAVLGAAMIGMLLGHSYLTAPAMSITPLSRVNWYLGGAVVCRGILSAIALASAGPELTGATYGMWLTLRWLAGVLGPLVACAMVARILKYRNTQAATGVLFVAVILTFIGELTASLLFQDLHLPL